MSSQPQSIQIQARINIPRWIHRLTILPLPLSTCKQRSTLTIISFFLLVLFETLRISVPGSVFLNAVFGPVSFIAGNPHFIWLNHSFVTRINSSSISANAQSWIGLFIIVIGFLIFCAIVLLRFSNQITGNDDITSGFFNSIRHPQFTALAICGAGMLLLWPRYIVLAMYIAMLFGCYFLARIREHEFKLKFGQAYIAYKARSGMFLPFRIPYMNVLPCLPRCGIKRLLVIFGIYALTVLTAFTLANFING